MTGIFAGQSYRVSGRVVVGMEEAGETYCWNEFNLEDSNGKSITLVYEETEKGGEWRLFALFDPQSPLSAQEAARKRVGDTATLDGKIITVTLVSESHVYDIEGKGPEGLKVGDTARYFNAETQAETIVVSWTGDETEFYRGRTLPPLLVANAFGLPIEKMGASFRPASSRIVVAIICAFFLVVGLFCLQPGLWSNHLSGPTVKPKLPPSPLTVGEAGKLDGIPIRIRDHAITEIAQMDQIYDCHEYHLFDGAGNRLLLIYGFKPFFKNWFLFTPFQPEISLTPYQAAAKCGGQTMDLNGLPARITDLCRVTIGKSESQELPEFGTGTVFYGFSARSGTNLFFARWNENGIAFFRGKPLPAKEVAEAFGQKTEK